MRSRDDPAGPPRFPYVAAVLCAACMGAAAWTWMRYSYRWEVTPKELAQANYGAYAFTPPKGTYVRIRGMLAADRSAKATSFLVRDPTDCDGAATLDIGECDKISVDDDTYCDTAVLLNIGECQTGPSLARSPTTFVGRVVSYGAEGTRFGDTLCVWLNTDASRFTGASIAGLVVGAMGVFVFTVALRHWLGERRRFREDTVGA